MVRLCTNEGVQHQLSLLLYGNERRIKKERQMSTLHLTLKKQWFDMILSGMKTEEYREIKPYYNLRLIGKEYDTVVFRNGYARDAPSLTVELKTIRFGTGKTKWGAEANKKYFVLYLGKIINTKNIDK